MYNPDWKDFRLAPMQLRMRVWQVDAIYELCRRKQTPFNIVLENILNDYFEQNPIKELSYYEGDLERYSNNL